MRIFKKLIRKLYHLIWFLSVFLLVSPVVYATDGEITASIRSSEITQSSQFQCYNNSHSSISTSFISNVGYATYYQCYLGSTNGYISFNVNHALVTDTLYQLTLYIGNQNGNPMGHSNTNTSVGSGITVANTNNRDGLQRVNIWNFGDTWNINTNIDVSNGEIDVQPRIANVHLYFITFSVPTDGFSFLNVPIQFGSSTENVYFYGYNFQVIGRVGGLTRSDVQSVISSSGLATANSVSQVQQSVTRIQQDISSSANNIINNDNQNTQSIIDNNNQNTQQQIESQKVCEEINNNNITTNNKYLTSNGSEDNTTYWGITDYIKVKGKTVTVLLKDTGTAFTCFYRSDKTLISCTSQANMNDGDIITLPLNTYYMRSSINKVRYKPTFEICQNGNQALNDSVDSLNDNIIDSNVDSSDSTINNLKNQIPTNSVISDLLLLPVRFLQNFVNALGSSCSQFNLGSLYGTNLYMPCINIENYLGSSIWTTIDLIISGLFVYALRKKFIQIYENLTNLKNGGNEID